MRISALKSFFCNNKSTKNFSENFLSPDDLKKNPITTVMHRDSKFSKVIKTDTYCRNKRETTIVKYDYSNAPVTTTVFTKIKRFVDGVLVDVEKKSDYQHQPIIDSDIFSGFFNLLDKDI